MKWSIDFLPEVMVQFLHWLALRKGMEIIMGREFLAVGHTALLTPLPPPAHSYTTKG